SPQEGPCHRDKEDGRRNERTASLPPFASAIGGGQQQRRRDRGLPKRARRRQISRRRIARLRIQEPSPSLAAERPQAAPSIAANERQDQGRSGRHSSPAAMTFAARFRGAKQTITAQIVVRASHTTRLKRSAMWSGGIRPRPRSQLAGARNPAPARNRTSRERVALPTSSAASGDLYGLSSMPGHLSLALGGFVLLARLAGRFGGRLLGRRRAQIPGGQPLLGALALQAKILFQPFGHVGHMPGAVEDRQPLFAVFDVLLQHLQRLLVALGDQG